MDDLNIKVSVKYKRTASFLLIAIILGAIVGFFSIFHTTSDSLFVEVPLEYQP